METILQKNIEKELKDAYIDYSMSVIVGRALPDVKDGLKPVHRRVLFIMKELGLLHNKPFKKSAKVVGDCLAKLHPHGDMAVYDTMVRMAQDFSLRYKLIDGQGNWGCFTGDTKVKLTDGRDLSFTELIKEHKQGKKNYTYTMNNEGLIDVAEIKSPRLTKRNQKIIKVILDNGEEIKCTLDHKFMLRDGSYKEAQYLMPEDSLMPVYNQLDMIEQAKRYNPKILKLEILPLFEDVYDLTIEGTHNFALAAGIFVHNSIDGDGAASYRYTEARMSKIAEEMLEDIEKDTVDFTPNFDASEDEPVVLPAKLPNLLINGSTGIAVGMATNIPPHNLIEVCDAAAYIIDKPDATSMELMQFIKGPDFPTAGLILGTAGVKSAYLTGKGHLRVRAKTIIEKRGNNENIIVTEIPYQVNKSAMIEAIAEKVNEKIIEGISDIRDESDKNIRVVIELKKDANSEVVLNQLFKNSQLETTFGVNMLALHENQPKVMNLKEVLQHYIDHRVDVVTKRTKYDLRKAEERAHVLEGLKIALTNIDNIIKGIKASKNAEAASVFLMNSYNLSEIQAKAILEMKLQKLTSLEQESITTEHTDLMRMIKEYNDILASQFRIFAIIKEEINELKQKYGDDRRTEILDVYEEIETEDLIPEEDVVIIATYSGYVKRMPTETYKQQKRGGQGIIGTETKDEEDAVEHIFTSSTHSTILCFTNQGRVYWLKGWQIPEASRYAKGKAMINLLALAQNEKINAMIPIKHFNEKHYLIMITKHGTIKKTELEAYANPRKAGIIAINLNDNDELVQVRLTPGVLKFIIGTANGMAVKFDEKDVRPVGRNAMGVRGIRLEKDDYVIGLEVALEIGDLLTVTENGFGKRTKIADYRLTRRGSKGVINIKTTERNGKVAGIKTVMEKDEVLIISDKGVVIRVNMMDVSEIGRNTQGVTIMKLKENDKVTTLARVITQVKK